MKVKDYTTTFILVAIVLFLALQRDSGFGFLLFLLIFIIITLFKLVRMVQNPADRKEQLTRIGIWAAALTVIAAVHLFWSTASRNNAELVAQEILAYQAHTNSYPATLGQLGIDEQEFGVKWKIRYVVRDGQGTLTYPSAFMPLTNYEYDFKAHKWVINSY